MCQHASTDRSLYFPVCLSDIVLWLRNNSRQHWLFGREDGINLSLKMQFKRNQNFLNIWMRILTSHQKRETAMANEKPFFFFKRWALFALLVSSSLTWPYNTSMITPRRSDVTLLTLIHETNKCYVSSRFLFDFQQLRLQWRFWLHLVAYIWM